MVSLTATIFKAIINDSIITATNTEYIIDVAISQINLYSGRDLPMMSGSAGSKTVSLDTKEYAAVMEAARAIYLEFYKGFRHSLSLGGIAVTPLQIQSNPLVQATIQNAARQLAEFDVDYG